ncbi:MAG: cytochrome-c peroxidase [Kordia sp.]|nr:MAG: cytochrome-c peroxidase [Kordia sp.]
MKKFLVLFAITLAFFTSCSDDNSNQIASTTPVAIDISDYLNIDFNNLSNYAFQTTPVYITKDNTVANPITNEGATLGRILFYDENLSSDNTVSCSTCHQQVNAFSDIDVASSGVNGLTGRHSMRLINSRFSNETKFFWDERANTLEEQTTMPIQDHNEMGFSGTNGDGNFNDLIIKLNDVEYYPELFEFAFGDQVITEQRIQSALAQFIRSIQSFDSKYDVGRTFATNDQVPFTNFTAEENTGKQLFLTPPTFDGSGIRTGGGVGCSGCHAAPEFDIDPNTLNNGIIGVLNSVDTDLTITRAPSLRDLFKTDGTLNGGLMHTSITDINSVIEHYNQMPPGSDNAQLDPRLKPAGNIQNLNMTTDEKSNLISFLKTLSGTDVYSNEKWADPFVN